MTADILDRTMPPPRRRAGGGALWADRNIKWLLVAPAVLILLALSIYPLFYSLWVAFIHFDVPVPTYEFVGLDNFRYVVRDPVALQSLWTTVWLSVANVAIQFLLGLGLALAMTRVFRGRGIIMLILIIPLFISPIVVGQFWSLILSKPYGPFDYLVGLILGAPSSISWLNQVPYNFIAIMAADAWQWTPFMFVILLAGLTSVSPELYEAAELDGLSRWQVFRNITLPQIVPLILIAITFRLLDAMKMFDVIFMMTGGGPGTTTYTASFYLYQIGFQQFHLSMATAGSWLFVIVTAVFIMILVRRMLRPEPA